MQPLLVHYCNTCTYNSSIPFTASVFSQNLSCSHCGAISEGINIRGKQQEEASMQQEELARLFSANMNLSQIPQQAAQPEQQTFAGQPVQQQEQDQAQMSPPTVYASVHYTHSYHVFPTRNIASQSEKTYIDAPEHESIMSILLRNSIDPSLLFPSQIDLFQNADNDQRLRLLELWRISPPQGRQGFPDGVEYSTSRQLYDWPPTSLAQEETMAKLRYERMMEDRAQSAKIQKHQHQLDQSMDTGTESAAVQETRDLLTSSTAEPYIVSGYDMLAAREYEQSADATAKHLRESTKHNQATDPVYNQIGGNAAQWGKNAGSILDMENQYGAFAYARDHDAQPISADEEMVM